MESILTLDRLRQSVAVKELEQVRGPALSMRKTASVPNFSQVQCHPNQTFPFSSSQKSSIPRFFRLFSSATEHHHRRRRRRHCRCCCLPFAGGQHASSSCWRNFSSFVLQVSYFYFLSFCSFLLDANIIYITSLYSRCRLSNHTPLYHFPCFFGNRKLPFFVSNTLLLCQPSTRGDWPG